jgi:TonB family protein
MNRFFCALLLVAASLPALAEQRWAGYMTAKVAIDSTGRVTSVELNDPTISKAMQQRMVQRLHAIEFEPALLNGKPAAAEATLNVRIAVAMTPEGLVAAIDDISIIIGYRKTNPPRYPPGKLRRGIIGMAEVKIAYDADGKVTSVAPAGSTAPDDPFMVAALKAAQGWEFEPERVAGHGVPGTATIPVRFTLSGGDSLEEDGQGILNFRDGGKLNVFLEEEAQHPLADSAVRVRSFVAAQEPISDG